MKSKRWSAVKAQAWVAVVACAQLIMPFNLLTLPAQAGGSTTPVTTPTTTNTAATTTTAITGATRTTTPHPINLDLTSTLHSVTAGSLHNFQPASIVVNGQTQNVTATTALTRAEVVALEQVLHTGRQTITLGANGNAVGGSFTIGSYVAQNLANLIVPSHVTTIDRIQTLNLSGNFTNAGAFYAVSTSPSVTQMSINAQNITNQAGGLITTVLPAGGIAGVTGALSTVNLALNAANNIVNAGTISSSGNLSLSAGGSITNAANAVLSAANNANCTSLAGTFNNAGLIAAQAGNVNFSTGQMVADMTINNAGGTVQALQGQINVRDQLFTGAANTTLTGGDWLSQQLNINSGTGGATVNVGNVTGTLSVSAGSLHLDTQAPNLTVGTLDITGDPVLQNSGNVDIGSLSPVSGQSYVIVAGGNITDTGASGIDTSNVSGSGGNVVLVAGANNVATTADGSSLVIGANTGSASGGNITVTNSNPVVISGSNTNQSGTGQILSGSFVGGGAVAAAVTTGSLTTGGSPVTILAGTNAAGANAAVTVSAITTTPSFGAAGGDVNIMAGIAGSGTADIFVNASSPITTTGGSGANGGNVSMITPGNINMGSSSNITTTGGSGAAGGNVLLFAGTPGTASVGAINTQGITTSGSTAGGNVEIVTIGGTAANPVGVVTGAITTDASGTAAGTTAGAVTVSAATGTVGPGQISAQATGSTSANATFGGDVLLTSGNAPGVATNTVAVPGGINTSTASTASTSEPGQIYAIVVNNGVAGASLGTTTQNGGSNTSALASPTVAMINQGALGTGSQSIIFTPSPASGTPGSVSGFSAGGFTSISDSGGAVSLTVTSSVANTNSNHNLIVPIIALGSMSLNTNGGSITSTVTSGAASNVSLFASSINAGSSLINFNLAASGANFPLVAVATNNGTATVRGSQANAVNAWSVLANGTVFLEGDGVYNVGD